MNPDVKVFNLKGATIYCAVCDKQADHNANWHREQEKDP